MTNGTPFIAAPLYNDNGAMAFMFNRVKAVHIACKGDIARDWSYRFKMSFNRTWGTAGQPITEILDNFSTFVECRYQPQQLKGWSFTGALAFDSGDIYGDNVGFQLKIRKRFWQ